MLKISMFIKAIVVFAALLLFVGCGGSSKNDNNIDTTVNTNIEVNGSIVVEKNVDKVISLTLSAPQTYFVRQKDTFYDDYTPARGIIRAIGHFEDGHSEELSDRVTWEHTGNGITVYEDVFNANEGNFTLQATYQDIVSNSLEIFVKNDKDLYLIVTKEVDKRAANLAFRLFQKPTHKIEIKLSLNPEDKVGFETNVYPYVPKYEKILVFTPAEYDVNNSLSYNPKRDIKIKSLDTNSIESYTIMTHKIESQDSYYSESNPEDIEIAYTVSIPKLIIPSLAQRKGAIRGVGIHFVVSCKTYGLKYTLVNPPLGMKIEKTYFVENTDIDGVVIRWDVPMDAVEGKIYNIKVNATDKEGETQTIEFPIKVPQTITLKTIIKNNELIVADENSPLYGMKMKAEGGDLSQVRLRIVDYGDVWKHHSKKLNLDNKIGYTVFIIDNMPNKINIKFPSYMDTYKKRNEKGAYFDKYFDDGTFLSTMDAWDWRTGHAYNYNNTNGISIPKNFVGEEDSFSKVFIFTINEKL